MRRDYVANGGWETFLSYEDPRQDILVGLLRLRQVGSSTSISACAPTVNPAAGGVLQSTTVIPAAAQSPQPTVHARKWKGSVQCGVLQLSIACVRWAPIGSAVHAGLCRLPQHRTELLLC